MGIGFVMLNMAYACTSLGHTRTSPHLQYEVDQYGMAFVDATGDVGVAAGAKDWCGAGVGVDAGKVGGSQGEAAVRDRRWRRCRGGRRRSRSGRKRRSSPPKMRAQNLKRESTSGKKGGRSVPRRRFSKSNRPHQYDHCWRLDLKKRGRRLVSVDARWRKQTRLCRRAWQKIQSALNKERVDVDLSPPLNKGKSSEALWMYWLAGGQQL